MAKIYLVCSFICLFLYSPVKVYGAATDTITAMAYNLLFYGFNTSFCTSTNNNVDLKDKHLRTIISYTDPDIFVVNELGRGVHNANRILDEVMNHEDVLNDPSSPIYSRATSTNTRNSIIVNMLYYKHDLFGIHSEAVISNELRDINLYTLYYKDDNLILGDTTFLSCIVAHLKAGSSNDDQQTRLTEIQNVMGYITQNTIRGNLVFMGDLNMRSSDEQAYELLTDHPNEEIWFYDPVGMPGEWSNNPEMSRYHTQSTRKELTGCFASGGMDDRFDQILVSKAIMEGSLGAAYIEGSYRTLGQDGKRFNEAINDPSNYSEPEEIIDALYHMSDHLPVMLNLAMGVQPTDANYLTYDSAIKLVNPVSKMLNFQLTADPGPLTVKIISMYNGLMYSADANHLSSVQDFSIDVSGMPPGVYILWIGRNHQTLITEKLLIH